MLFAGITTNMAVISNTTDNRTLTKQNLLLYVSQPPDETKNVPQSINYKIFRGTPKGFKDLNAFCRK